MKRILFLLFFGLTFTQISVAQEGDDIYISGTFDSLRFTNFIADLEQKNDIQFYYKQEWLDTMWVIGHYEKIAFDEFMSDYLKGTDLFMQKMDGNRFIITKGYDVRSNLPDNYFNVSTNVEDINITSVDFNNEQEEQRIRNLLESKLFIIGKKENIPVSGKVVVAGHVREKDTGEPLIGAIVYIENPQIGVATDAFGYYSIELPVGRTTILIKCIGMKETRRQVELYSNGKLNIEMEEDVIPLREIVIEADKDINVAGMQMGMEKLDARTAKSIPAVLGEVDIVKVALTLPGVQTVGEAASGFNVRGGSTDQNLMLINHAPIYNSSHLFGFFSVFNPDIIKTVELYKSAIPAEYGGRISSVFDVYTRDGNRKKFSGMGGIGPVTGRLTLEGPTIKEKGSYIFGVRSTYSDWILKKIDDIAIKNSEAGFYDFNAKISHDINKKNSVFISGYYSGDRFRFNSDSTYNYHNKNASAQWKHIFNNQFFAVLTGTYSEYGYRIKADEVIKSAFTMGYDIKQINGKLDFNYSPNTKHKVDFGLSGIKYKLNPGTYLPLGDSSKVIPQIMEEENGVEAALYIGENFELNQVISIYAGIRYSLFYNLGPKTVYQYSPGGPRTSNTLIDSVRYGSCEKIANYHGPEYRISSRIRLGGNSSIKLSYNRMRQYVHMLSNTTSISPTDVWKLSDSYLRPQIGDQFAIGFYKNFNSNAIEASVETYYKKLKDILDYKGGAKLILNKNIETDVLNGKGKAYGLEFIVKKKAGKLNGWISYTYSRILHQVKSDIDENNINHGEWYPANYDKPHSLSVISNFKFTQRFNISANLTYSTGRPITYPVALYDYQNSQRIHYSDRNKYRVPNYFRADLALNIEGNHKVDKIAHSSWTISLYNLTGRKNVYSIFFKTGSDGKVNGYKMSVFGQVIPTVTYNFKF